MLLTHRLVGIPQDSEVAYRNLNRPFQVTHLHINLMTLSDQGSHYASPIFQKQVGSYGLKQSMLRRGNCCDNAPQESFYGHFKGEANIKQCASFNELMGEIDDYMNYHNHHRYQCVLKKMTLLDMLINKTVEIAIEKDIIKSKSIIVDATHSKARYNQKPPKGILTDLSKKLRKLVYEIDEKMKEKKLYPNIQK